MGANLSARDLHHVLDVCTEKHAAGHDTAQSVDIGRVIRRAGNPVSTLDADRLGAHQGGKRAVAIALGL